MKNFCFFLLSLVSCVLLAQDEVSSVDEMTVRQVNEKLSVVEADQAGNGKTDMRHYEKTRLGFVNIRRIMAAIPQVAFIGEDLDKEFAERKKQLNDVKSQLLSMENKLKRLYRGDEYFALEKQIIAKRRDMLRLEESFRDDYSVRRNEELAKLQRLIVDDIVALAKEYDFDVILNDTGVIYVSEKVDLTSVVIRRLKDRAEMEHKSS